MTGDLESALAETGAHVTRVLDRLMPLPPGPEARLIEAMRYAALSPGKRLRPFLTVETGRLFGAPDARLFRAAAAIECVHAYSLIHDDLPCMDDDMLRRGRPTVHIAFDEATALLAGDALQSLAFGVLAHAATHPDAALRGRLIAFLAEAIGAGGMAGGQMLDLMAGAERRDLGFITRLQRLKTGALIGAAVAFGAELGGAGKAEGARLAAYAHDLGLAFQIADDLLDAEGKAEVVGKETAKDAGRGKATFLSLLGIEAAKAQGAALAAQAAAHLAPFGPAAARLVALAGFVIARQR